MWDFLASLLFDVLVPDRWKDEEGHVDGRWLFLGLVLALLIAAGLVFGVLYLLGVH